MGIKIGDVDIVKEIVDLNYQLLRTQLILEHILNNNANLNKPDSTSMKAIDDKAIETLQKKYPNMGISKT